MKNHILKHNTSYILTTLLTFTAFNAQGSEEILPIDLDQEQYEYTYEVPIDEKAPDETVLSIFFDLKKSYHMDLEQKLSESSPVEKVTTHLKDYDPHTTENGYTIPLFADTEKVILHVSNFGPIEDIPDALEVQTSHFNQTISRTDWKYEKDRGYQIQLENQDDLLRLWLYQLADEQAQVMICNNDNCQTPQVDVNKPNFLVTSGPITDVYLKDVGQEKLPEFTLPFYVSTMNVYDSISNNMVIAAGSGDWNCEQSSEGTRCQNVNFTNPFEVIPLGRESTKIILTWTPLVNDIEHIEMKINDQTVSYSQGSFALGAFEDLDQYKITILDKSGNRKDIVDLIEYGEAVIQIGYPKEIDNEKSELSLDQ